MEQYQNYLNEFKKNERGYATIFIIVLSCLGSISAMYILMRGTSITQMFQLFLAIVSCMGFNASILSQQKPKIVFNLFIIGLVLNLLLLVLNTI